MDRHGGHQAIGREDALWFRSCGTESRAEPLNFTRCRTSLIATSWSLACGKPRLRRCKRRREQIPLTTTFSFLREKSFIKCLRKKEKGRRSFAQPYALKRLLAVRCYRNSRFFQSIFSTCNFTSKPWNCSNRHSAIVLLYMFEISRLNWTVIPWMIIKADYAGETLPTHCRPYRLWPIPSRIFLLCLLYAASYMALVDAARLTESRLMFSLLPPGMYTLITRT